MSLLERLAARWRRRWLLGAVVAAAATGMLVGTGAGRVIDRGPLLAGLAAGVSLALVLALRRRHVDVRTIARHLNRVVPTLEESADLLLVGRDSLFPLERLQRDRVERALARLAEPPALPHRAFRAACTYAAIALAASVGLALWPGRGRAGGRIPRASVAPHAPPRIVQVEVAVRPPRYTGKPARSGRKWDVAAEQGAHVTWRVWVDRAVTGAFLLTTDGDTLPLARRREGGAEYQVSLTAERSLLYQVRLEDGGAESTSEFHRLAVLDDAPPTLTVVRPEPRTAVAVGTPAMVPLEVLAGDDYGVSGARIVATVTTGQGEGVRFREQVLAFDDQTPRRHDAAPGLVLRKTFDLASLGMRPGDELYFHVVASDNRSPAPNQTRSETYFVTLADTGQVAVADLTGVAVSRLPEYFRSQRQIIIDTERLLAEQARLTPREFRDRSNNIGIDQHLLRERYSELVGDETVEAGPEPALEHQHDTEENATLLAQSVKGKLRAALAQMWDAELQLRTYHPKAALPFEYRALELLKDVQQAARVYVQRVGFEPPPLEPDRKRLTGTLTAIGNPSRTREIEAETTLPASRAALAIVQRLLAGGTGLAGDPAALERAGREIARLAIDDPARHLETLGDLRTLVDSLRSPAGAVCRACLPRVERGIWRALPAPGPAEAGRGNGSGVARAYFDLLHGNP